jgi:uncharacterized protein YecT (DUF1311 family)
VELTKNFKMDLTTVQDIQGRAITLGDVVANSIPVNRFHQIISHFEVLLDTKLRPLLVNAVDRWRTEIEMQPPEPIIRDYDRMAGRLTRLFEVRHILCHELPSRAVYSAEEAGEFLDEAASFAQALEEVLTFRKYGRVPLTQTEMNIQAHEDLNRKTEELDGLLSNIREYIDDSDKRFFSLLPDFVKQTQLECFNDLQEKWVAYRNAQADFETHENLGGTIRPTLWSSIATQITKERIAHLRNWYEARLERSGYKDS